MKTKKSLRLYIFIISSIICITGAISGIIIWSINQFGSANAASTSDLNGKSVLFDGDSIAMGSVANGEGQPRWSYANHLEETYGISRTNVSYGGARFYWPNAPTDCPEAYYSSNSNSCHIIGKHLTSTIKNTTYDYIILEGAINDLYGSVFYYGNKESYKTELRQYFNTITNNSKWANAKIGFVIVPLQNYAVADPNYLDWYNPSLDDEFWKSVQSICDEYSIDYINFYKYSSDDDFTVPSGFNYYFMFNTVQNANDVGSFDGHHPSKGGQRYLGEYIANWMINLPNYKYTVKFNSNGSSLSGAEDQSVVHGKKAIAPTYTINPDEHFYYWSTSSACTTSFNFNTVINKNLTLYACWSPIFKLQFNANNGTGAPASKSCRIDFDTSCSITISSDEIPTRDNFYFYGWWDNSTETRYQPGDSITLTGNKTLYAIWYAKLSFNTNNGTGGPSEPLYCNPWTGSSCTVDEIPTEKPTRTGFNFIGWWDNSAETLYQPGDSITLTGNKTLYASWTAKLTYNANDGSGAPSSEVCSPWTSTSCSITISSTKPTRDGYTFLGWADSSTATTAKYQPGDSITLTGNKTIYAVWQLIPVNPAIDNRTNGNAEASVSNGTLTVSSSSACVVIGVKNDSYTKLAATTSGTQNNITTKTYSASSYDSVIVALKGDGDFDGVVSTADSNLINRSLISTSLRPYRALSALERLVLDIDGDSIISTSDSNLINRSLISHSLTPYKEIEW